MTPSGFISASGSTQLTVKDGDGRVLVVRRLNPLDRLRLFKALGPSLAQNDAYLGMAAIAAAVIEIDAVPVPPPVSEGQIEGIIGRLGETGVACVSEALSSLADAVMGSDAQGN